MTRVRAFALGVWDFIVGDDWRTAAGVLIALGVTALVASASIPAWWITPVIVVGLLMLSLRRAVR